MVPREVLIKGATEQLQAALETDDPEEKDFYIRSALQRYDIIENDDMYR